MICLSNTVRNFGLPVVIFAVVFLSAQSVAGDPTPAAQNTGAVMLLYEEKEAGTDSYPIRMIITDDFVRSDDGIDDGAYFLFDRKEKVLYSVLPENQRMLVLVQARLASDLPETLEFDIDVQPDRTAPSIQGHQVYSYTLTADDQVCQNATVVPGLLEGAVKAIGEVRTLLSGRQFRDLEKTPKEFRTPCFLANYVYASGENLEHGLPIQESNNDGLSRILIDFDANFEADAALLELPEGYRQFTMP
jgi:hypothetical protein